MTEPNVASTTALWEIWHSTEMTAWNSLIKVSSPDTLKKTLRRKQSRQTNVFCRSVSAPMWHDCSSCKSPTSQNRLFLNNKMNFCSELCSVFNYPHNQQQMFSCSQRGPVALLGIQWGNTRSGQASNGFPWAWVFLDSIILYCLILFNQHL